MATYSGPVRPGDNEEIFRLTGDTRDRVYEGPIQPGTDEQTFRDTGESSSSSGGGGGGGSDIGDGNSNNSGSIRTQVGDKWFDSQSDALAYQQEQARQQALEEQRMREENIRSSISDAYTPIHSYYDQAPGNLQQTAADQSAYVEDQYGIQEGGVQDTRTHGLQGLERSREQVTQNKADTLRDLSQNLRDTFRAGNMYLGVRGASDSSATRQMSEALQKASNRNVADVGRQAMGQYGDIDQRAADIEYQTGQALKDLGSWKSTQLVGVTSWLNDQLATVSKDKAMAQGEEKMALANLEQSLFQQASDRLAQIDTAILQEQQNIAQWSREQAAQTAAYQRDIASTATFNTPPITSNSLDVPGQLTSNTGAQISPYARPVIDEEDEYYRTGGASNNFSGGGY